NIAGDGAKSRIGIEYGCFAIAARIVPEDAGTQYLVPFVQQGSAMHLTGKTDTGNRRKLLRMGRAQAVNRCPAGVDPMCRVLFAPARMGSRNIQFAMGRPDDGL